MAEASGEGEDAPPASLGPGPWLWAQLPRGTKSLFCRVSGRPRWFIHMPAELRVCVRARACLCVYYVL